MNYFILIYGGSFAVLWLVFKLSNLENNPLRNLWFWVTVFFSGIGITALFIYLFLRAFGGDLPPPKEGWNRKYFDNGKLESEFFIKNGKKEGYHKSWYSNGQLEYLFKYANDVEEDTSITFFETGKVMSIQVYKEGREWRNIYFYPTGIKESELYSPLEKNKDNFRIDYYPNGNKKFETKISNYTFEGPGVYYFADGDTSFTGNYKDGLMDGVWFKYDSTTNKIVDKDTFNFKVVKQFKKSW